MLLILLFSKGMNLKTSWIDVLYVGISFFVLALFHVGVDINSVEDLPKYSRDFITISSSPIGQIFDFSETSDHMYSLLNKMVSLFTDDFSMFLLVYNVILLCSHFYFFKSYSPYIPLSILLFILLSYNQSLFVLRQYLALSIILFSVPCIIKKELGKFILLCIIAFFFHSSSVVWFQVYFIYNIRDKKYFFMVLIFVLLLIAVVSYSLRDFMFLFGSHYVEYIEQQENAYGAIVVRLFYFLTYGLFLKKHVMDDGINKLCFMALFIVLVVFMFDPPLRSVSRLLHYFTTLSMISIPITLKYMKSAILRLMFLSLTVWFYGQQYLSGLKEDYFSNYQFINPSIIVYIIIGAFSIYIVLKNSGRRIKKKQIIQPISM